MIVSLVYSVAMNRFYVHIKGNQNPIMVKAARLEEDDNSMELIAYDQNNRVIGKFNQRELVGWWMGQE